MTSAGNIEEKRVTVRLKIRRLEMIFKLRQFCIHYHSKLRTSQAIEIFCNFAFRNKKPFIPKVHVDHEFIGFSFLNFVLCVELSFEIGKNKIYQMRLVKWNTHKWTQTFVT